MNTKLIKKGKNLLLTSILAGIWLGNSSAIAQQTRPTRQVSDAQVNAMVEALRKAAPPNRANDGMYSDWQVLPAIIPDWTKRCLGRQLTPAEFEADAKAARDTVACIARREFNRVYSATGNETAAVRGAACWWMTGKDNGCTSGVNAAYVQRVVGFYQQPARTNTSSPTQKPAASQSKPAATPAAESATPTAEPASQQTEEPAASPKPTSIN
ncbi:hypothetical protein ACE1CI_38100 [Aerosakkonemataceae cyanobacterium BLCC-F50]|uniref:Uncharacterized protein n=1 Tax=Floridaenema flaviceps BLCC-F50 TaxID=3153642 RepID=A0ABV4Y4C4_9CYAN